jgi:hypothetical protein
LAAVASEATVPDVDALDAALLAGPTGAAQPMSKLALNAAATMVCALPAHDRDLVFVIWNLSVRC